MVGRCIQDVVDGARVQYVLVRDNICGRRTMDAKDAGGAIWPAEEEGPVWEDFESSDLKLDYILTTV